jgi:hypothetical protein
MESRRARINLTLLAKKNFPLRARDHRPEQGNVEAHVRALRHKRGKEQMRELPTYLLL